MSTKRRPLKRDQRRRITLEAVQAYQAGEHLRLHRALGLMPWDASPLDEFVTGPCPYPPGNCIAQSWEMVRELRQMLESAVAASINLDEGSKQ